MILMIYKHKKASPKIKIEKSKKVLFKHYQNPQIRDSLTSEFTIHLTNQTTLIINSKVHHITLNNLENLLKKIKFILHLQLLLSKMIL
jgi:hypothetical protein